MKETLYHKIPPWIWVIWQGSLKKPYLKKYSNIGEKEELETGTSILSQVNLSKFSLGLISKARCERQVKATLIGSCNH
jgi:hypothetical protein